MAFIGSSGKFLKNKIYPLAQTNQKISLVHSDKFFLIDNICKHRQAIILKEEKDYFGIVTCPLHGWTYDNGILIGEPASFFSESKCLDKKSVFEYNGLLFSEDPMIDWESIPHSNLWNPKNYVYTNTIITDCNYDYEYFMEAVLDSYHLAYVHPGLSSFCDISSYQQESGKGYAFQITKLHQPFLNNASTNYQKFQDHIAKNYPNRWNTASIWLVLYPNLIIDYYPGTCVVYSVWPTANGCRVVLDFHYEDDIAAFDPEFITLQQACFDESQLEDDELSIRIQSGRTNVDECYTHPLESQIDHFYKHKEYQRFIKF